MYKPIYNLLFGVLYYTIVLLYNIKLKLNDNKMIILIYVLRIETWIIKYHVVHMSLQFYSPIRSMSLQNNNVLRIKANKSFSLFTVYTTPPMQQCSLSIARKAILYCTLSPSKLRLVLVH